MNMPKDVQQGPDLLDLPSGCRATAMDSTIVLVEDVQWWAVGYSEVTWFIMLHARIGRKDTHTISASFGMRLAITKTRKTGGQKMIAKQGRMEALTHRLVNSFVIKRPSAKFRTALKRGEQIEHVEHLP